MIKNSQPSIKNRMIPVSREAAELGIPWLVWILLEPRSRTAMNSDTRTIAKGFILASQATVIAVKPTPFAVFSVRVPSEPET